eukprot:TRINITY_DN30231_c0_g4_i1.p1 TRINITY_DN30231_c0_g4~~TRINITY_DN30231_c0_g4_i1.p1  ORF type:complete len:425 (-),score=82.65 TRINITY_DN30231_c0_g4_i1:189-1400(-)
MAKLQRALTMRTLNSMVEAQTHPQETHDTPLDLAQRRVKVIATLGPACWDDENMDALIRVGVNIFRLNSAHRRDGQFEALVPRVRAAALRVLGEAHADKVQVMADLQGVKYRCAEVDAAFPDGVPLTVGEQVQVALTRDDEPVDVCREGRIVLTRTRDQVEMIQSLEVGMVLMLDDATMRLRVEKAVSAQDPDTVICRVDVGGKLKARKGINVPGLDRKGSALTVKDMDDLECLLNCGVDLIAMSFVERPADVEEVREAMKKLRPKKTIGYPKVLAKIEKPQAVTNIDAILIASDGAMVERGDLGSEFGNPLAVPFYQKVTLKKAQKHGVFCIVATQLIEHMMTHLTPSCAEVGDVANAVFDGASAVMLSGETAMGVDPINCVKVFRGIVDEAEEKRQWFLLD